MAYKIGDEEKDFKFIGEYATIESVYSLYPRGGCTGMWFTHTGDGNKRYNWSEFYNQWVPEDFVFPDPQNPTPIVEYLKGANGKNAYELAVENGFSGSLTEWLASLKGNAENGKSAYELAVAAGYSGTLEEWLESFVSPYSLAALFLSAKDDDTAEGKITFEKGLDVKDRIASDNFVEGALGHRTTKEGDAELKSLKVREFIETPELRKNRISVNGNEFWFTDVCVVESIEQQLNPDHFIIHPRLLEGDLLSFHSSDILRGIFSYGDGFYTCVLQVVVVHEDLKSMEVVTLNGRQPRAAMVLARQTNAVDTDRQGSIYADGLNKYIRVINGYDPENPGELGNIANLKLQIGDLSGINHPAFGQLSGYGLFAANVYLLGTIMQASWDGSQYMRPSFWRGVYNPLTLYGPGETVSFVKPGYGESTWICKKPTKGNDPSNTEFWDPYVSGGKTGAPGADGMNSYTAVLYQRSADSPVPAKPSDSLLYNFVTKELTDPLGVLGAWSIGIPAVNGLPLWVITATVASRTDTDTIETGDWLLPSMQLKDGEDGKDGKSIEFIFKRANTIPTVPDSIQTDDHVPEGWSDDQLGVSAQYPFEWACKRTKADGVWSAWIGPSLWGNWAEDGSDGVSIVSVVPQFAVNSSDSIAPTTFSNEKPTRSTGQFLWVRDKITFSDNSVQYTPAWVVTGDPGTDGDNGTSSAPITLYKRSATVPAMPTGTFTYTFATGVLSGGTINGWSQDWPADDGNPCWVIYANASAATATVSIAASQFTDPPIEWVKSGINTAPVKLYQRKATAPAKPTDWVLYTFSTKSISDPLSVMGDWSTALPTSNGLPLYVIIAMAASRTDTDTINPGDWSEPSIETKDGLPGADGADGADGVNGTNGIPILFQGSYASVAALISDKGALQAGWSYYNTTDKKSYVYYPTTWYQMTVDGVDGANGTNGLSIVWKGDLAMPPANPVENWVYRDADNGYVYIYNGSAWELMVLDGTDGANGENGDDGFSVFITYNDNALTSEPSAPTGDGTTGGWHTAPTAACVWMSQKVAADASSGTWGSPIPIKGADGAAGIDARVVNLTLGKQGFTYDTNGEKPSPANTTVTATARNTTGTVYYQFFVNDISKGARSTTNTFTYYPPALYSDMPQKIEVQISEGADTTVLARDQITAVGMKAGANAITIVLTNDSHTCPVEDGVIDYTGSGTDIMVWEGTTQLTPDIVFPYANSTFRVTATTVSPANAITVGAQSVVGNVIRRAASSAMNQRTATIDFTIVVKNSAGVESTFHKIQSISKSLQGVNGEDGVTYYTWIRFSDNADGTGLYATPTAETAYIGIGANKTTATPSANKADYIWSRFRGGAGPKGDSYYIWIKYADDGIGTGLSDSPTGKTYIGIAYNKTTSTESTNPADYTWSKLQGEDGAQGRDGITIRVTEWSPGFEYHNDEALTSGIRYLDVVTVGSGATQTRHLCKVTHTSSLANKPSTTESTEWQTFNQMAPIYASMLISPYAVLDFLQGQKILLRDASGNIKGLVSSEGDGATGWVFMAGSDDPETAPFKVNQLGQVFMDSLFIRTAASGARLEIDSSSMGIKMYDGNGILKGSYLPAPVKIIDEDNIGTPTVVNSSPASLTADTASVSINYAETPISKTDTIEPANTVTITGAGTWMLTTPAVSYSVSGGSTYGSYSIRVWLIKNGTNLYNAGSRSGKGSASGTIPAGNIAGMTAGVYTIRIDVTMNEEYNTCSASASIGSGNNFYASSVVTKNEIGTDGFNFIKSPTDYVLNSNGTFVSRKGKMRLEASDTKVEARNLTTNKLVLAPLDADECVPVINTHGLICAGNVSSGGTISNKYGLNSSATPNDPVGTYVITHGFGSSAYSVNIVPFNSSAWLMWRVTARATTSFTVQFATTAGTATNTAFDFQMFAMR